MPDASYIHGTDPSEQDRLARLNAMTNAEFVRYLNPAGGDRVLEVGSGLGLLAVEVASRAVRVTGIEHAGAQLAEAQRRSSAPNVEFVQGDAHALPFADASFDLVYCRYVLEHLADPGRALTEMRRVLRPGGRVAVQENNIEINRFHPPTPRFDALWAKFGRLQSQLGGDASIGLRLFPLLKGAGFRSIELSIAPEVHWSGSPGFAGWVTNLIGNIRSGERALIERGLAARDEIEAAVAELAALMERDDGTAVFYWNRGTGTK